MSDWLDEIPCFVHDREAEERRRRWIPPPPPYEPKTPIIMPDLATLRRALDALERL
jgi:hypothetical protein